MRWFDEVGICVMCGMPIDGEEPLLCDECQAKLQTHYGQKCLNCGNYNFIEWTSKNVWDLCQRMKWDFEVIWKTDRIIIIPFKQCPKCCPYNDLCDTNMYRLDTW